MPDACELHGKAVSQMDRAQHRQLHDWPVAGSECIQQRMYPMTVAATLHLSKMHADLCHLIIHIKVGVHHCGCE